MILCQILVIEEQRHSNFTSVSTFLQRIPSISTLFPSKLKKSNFQLFAKSIELIGLIRLNQLTFQSDPEKTLRDFRYHRYYLQIKFIRRKSNLQKKQKNKQTEGWCEDQLVYHLDIVVA
ncbi:hypothetical protein MKW92_045413 [Papaver armeniacum]|nr:hypothetical protein MKW92_045413 [Papaver armeniacum]